MLRLYAAVEYLPRLWGFGVIDLEVAIKPSFRQRCLNLRALRRQGGVPVEVVGMQRSADCLDLICRREVMSMGNEPCQCSFLFSRECCDSLAISLACGAGVLGLFKFFNARASGVNETAQ